MKKLLESPKDGEIKNKKTKDAAAQPEIGGPKGPEPTRYGDWEIGGKCVDF